MAQRPIRPEFSLPPASQLRQPRHRASFLGRAGCMWRSLTGLLFGSKGAAFTLIAILSVVGGLKYRENSEANRGPSQAIATDATAAFGQRVTLDEATMVTVQESFSLTGTVVPKNLLQVAPAVGGLQIIEMRVEAGDRVSAGEILAILDNQVIDAQLQQAEANLVQAQAQLQRQSATRQQAEVLQRAAATDVSRYSVLYQEGAVSQEQLGERQVQAAAAQENVAIEQANWESAEATIAAMQAEINRLAATKAQTVVIAPSDGVIAERFATVGDLASGSAPLYSLIENGTLELALKPTQRQLVDIEVGMPVAIRTQTSASVQTETAPIRGVVEAIDPLVDPQSRQASVTVALSSGETGDNSSSRLRTGMFLQADVVTDQRRDVVVPAAAVVTQPDGSTVVFAAESGMNEQVQVQAVPVELGEQTERILSRLTATDTPVEPVGNYMAIRSGLEAGRQIVVEGAQYLQAGDRVVISAAN